MVNFGLLAAEIVSLVWGTPGKFVSDMAIFVLKRDVKLQPTNQPGNFNGFRVLAALLHGTLVVGVSQTLRR